MKTKRLWIIFIALMVITFSILGYFGRDIYLKAPPIPDKVVSANGNVLFTGQDIKDGQNVWQSMGGQEVGTIWGHGSYVAPDWSADWLHREAVFILNQWSQDLYKSKFELLDNEKQAVLKARLQNELRKNSYDKNTKELKVSAIRDSAIRFVALHYSGLFMNDTSLEKTRNAYAIPANTIKTVERMDKMNAFFFWTSWACVTQRPDKTISYTSNWPPDELVGNVVTSPLIIWTGFSVILLLIGIGLMVYYYARRNDTEELNITYPQEDPLSCLHPTRSMRSTLKYFWVVCGLILVQVLLGVITAHYGVEGNGFYGLSLSTILPYSVSRTWHVQLAIFWIAT